MTRRVDTQSVIDLFEAVCLNYQETSPMVSRWADNLYVACTENPSAVTLADIHAACQLADTDNPSGFVPGNLAQNWLYHHLESIGADRGVVDY